MLPGFHRKAAGRPPGPQGHAREKAEGSAAAAHPAEVFHQGLFDIPRDLALEGAFQPGVQPRGQVRGCERQGFADGIAPRQLA